MGEWKGRVAHFQTGAGGHVVRLTAEGSDESQGVQQYVHTNPKGGMKGVGFISVSEFGSPQGKQRLQREVGDVYVDPKYRGTGVAQGLWEVASQDHPHLGDLHHSPQRTEAGERFAQRVSGDRPDLIPPRVAMPSRQSAPLAEHVYPSTLRSLNSDLFHAMREMD